MEWLENLRSRWRSWDMNSDPRYGVVNMFRNYFFAAGILALLLASYAAYLGGGDGKTASAALGFRVLGLGLTLAAACTVGGWIVGLIFGVPRALAMPAGSTATSKVNTNLEDISDWLTKIIVGVGLTQLNLLPGLIENFAKNANDNGFNWPAHGHLLATGLLLYFTLGGFWLGYVYTRTGVTLLFGAIDHQLLSPPQLENAAKVDVDVNAGGVRPPTAAQLPVDQALLSTPLKDLSTAQQYMAWSGAQARAHHFEKARVALSNVLADEPLNADAKRQLYTVNRAEMLTALYQPPPDGYRRAIALGEELARDPKGDNDAELHIWLACAYGQQHRDAKPEDERNEARDNALREIKKAVALDPNMKARLRSYMDDPNALDNDLCSLRNDEAVRAALNA